MLSFTKGEPIAVICGGELDKKVVKLATMDGSVRECKDPPATEGDMQSLYDVLADDEFKLTLEQYRRLSDGDREKLRHAFGKARSTPVKTHTKEIILDSGVMIVCPSCETERVFIAGKSGSGKSTLAALYMFEYLNMFPGRKVVLISRHKNEKAYQHIPHMEIPLELFAKVKDDNTVPMDLDDLKDSLVVFDDTDNLQDKDIDMAIRKLNGDIISNGRKYNIHCVTLSHQIMNWQKTRDLLMEANKVYIFPGGNAHHIKTFLQKHAGLDAKDIKKIMELKSRWAMLSMGVPQYIVHEHGAFIV